MRALRSCSVSKNARKKMPIYLQCFNIITRADEKCWLPYYLGLLVFSKLNWNKLKASFETPLIRKGGYSTQTTCLIQFLFTATHSQNISLFRRLSNFLFLPLFSGVGGILYHKIPKISPGAYIFQRPFLRGLFLEGLIYGGKFAFQNRSG